MKSLKTFANPITLFVCEEVRVLEEFESTNCTFVIRGDFGFGYRYSVMQDLENPNLLNRAFDVLFEETWKRFRPG